MSLLIIFLKISDKKKIKNCFMNICRMQTLAASAWAGNRCGHSLCPQPLAMQPDRSRQQILDKETSSSRLTELQLFSSQRSTCNISQAPKWSFWCFSFMPDKDSYILHFYCATYLDSGGTNILEEDQRQQDHLFGTKEKVFKLEVKVQRRREEEQEEEEGVSHTLHTRCTCHAIDEICPLRLTHPGHPSSMADQEQWAAIQPAPRDPVFFVTVGQVMIFFCIFSGGIFMEDRKLMQIPHRKAPFLEQQALKAWWRTRHQCPQRESNLGPSSCEVTVLPLFHRTTQSFVDYFQLNNKNISNVMADAVNFKALHGYNEYMITVKQKTTCMFWPNVPCFELDSTKLLFWPCQDAVFLPRYSPFDFSTVKLRKAFKTSLHPSIIYNAYPFRGCGGAGAYPSFNGREAGYTLNRSPANCRATFETEIRIQQVKEDFEKQKSHGKPKLFQILNSSGKGLHIDAMYPDRNMRSILKNYLEEHKGRGNQYAFAIAYMKNGERKTFPKIYPDNIKEKKESSASSSFKHTEEILIEQIDQFLQSKNRVKVQRMLIYTQNSPCLERGNHVPCMYQLLEKSHQWRSEYGFSTDVIFSTFWGLTGPDVFKDLTYSDISEHSSVFYLYFETYKEIPFKLYSKDFRQNAKKSDIYQTLLSVAHKDRQKLKEKIQSALTELEKLADKSFGLSDEHLKGGEKMISSFHFQEKISDILRKTWNEMVLNSSVSPIRDKITSYFNTEVVKLFRKTMESFLGDSSPLRLYQLQN